MFPAVADARTHHPCLALSDRGHTTGGAVATDAADRSREFDVGLMNVHVELAEFGVVVDIASPGSYNPDQLDDMTRRAQRLLGTAVTRYVTAAERLSEPLDDEWQTTGDPTEGILVSDAPNRLEGLPSTEPLT